MKKCLFTIIVLLVWCPTWSKNLGRSLMASNISKELYSWISYFLIFQVNHNCQPNARCIFDIEGNVTLKAQKHIEKDDQITISYCSTLINTKTRLAKLKRSKFFVCQCKLCMDPTENGTFMSAVICPKCKIGKMLPESFHMADPNWHCDKCSFMSTDEKVTKLVDAVRNSYIKIIK